MFTRGEWTEKAAENENIFLIPDLNLWKLEEAIEKINKRADKLDFPRTFLAPIDHFTRKEALTIEDEFAGRKSVVHYTVVLIDGEQLKLEGGWVFAGTLEHTEEGNILRAVPGQTIPDRFRQVAPNCDHCNLDRKRNDTYIVINEAGEYLQVGKTCLKDYVGHRSPARIASFFSWLADIKISLSDPDDEYFHGGAQIWTWDLEKFLAFAAASIRLFGWTPRSKAHDYNLATADLAADWYRDAHSITRADEPGAVGGSINNRVPDTQGRDQYTRAGELIETTPADFELAGQTLEWVRALPEEETIRSDYLWNLRLACLEDELVQRHVGLVASAITAYQRAFARELEKAAEAEKSNEFIGEIKKRQDWTLKLVDVKVWGGGIYGPTYFHIFEDEGGNCIVWNASNTQLDQGETYTGKATVKDHDTYKGRNQTVITRAAFNRVCCDEQKLVKFNLNWEEHRVNGYDERCKACGTFANQTQLDPATAW
jgi:hypothetical protein